MYSISKLALNGLTKSLAKNVGKDNIRVNCIVAGLVNTKYADAVSYEHKFLVAIIEVA